MYEFDKKKLPKNGRKGKGSKKLHELAEDIELIQVEENIPSPSHIKPIAQEELKRILIIDPETRI
jgi:hypothetical protein